MTDKERLENIKYEFEMHRELSESDEEWLIKQVEYLETANVVIKEYNQMYLDRICKFKKDEERIQREEQRLHEQADLLREYRDEIERLKRRCVSDCLQD